MDEFLQAINCGVEEWHEEACYFDVALGIYESASTKEREKLKAKVLEQRDKNGVMNYIMLSRLIEVVCQCAKPEDVDFLLKKIKEYSVQQIFLFSENILTSPILCRELAEQLYLKIKGHDDLDLRTKKLIEIVYRLYSPFVSGKVDFENSEAIFDLNNNKISNMTATMKIKNKHIKTIYLLNVSQHIKEIKKYFKLCSEAVVIIGAASDMCGKIFQEFSKAGFYRFESIDQSVIYIIK